MERYEVLLREVIGYDYKKIREVIQEGMKHFGVKPKGRVFVKPNVIFAHKRYGTTGYTNPVVLRAVLEELSERKEVERITLGEHCAVTVPTRYAFSEAGYNSLKKIPKVRFRFVEEEPKIFIDLKKAAIHKRLPIAKSMFEADFKLWVPKLKHHASTKITCSLKLNLGILDSSTRLMAHDFRLEEKIADIYEAGYPDFIVVDAIGIGEQAELVPTLKRIDCIMMGTSGVAIDSVGARILGFQSSEIEHLRIARERGWQPVSDDRIGIIGDVSLEKLKERVGVLDRTYHDPRQVDTTLRFYLGNYPEGNRLCETGCNNMIKTALAIFNAYDPGCLKTAKPLAVVIGEYQGDVDGQGHRVVLVGDCARVKGKLTGKTYRVSGCPVLVPLFITPAAYLFGLKNPYNDPGALLPFPYFMGVSYLVKGANWFRTQWYKLARG